MAMESNRHLPDADPEETGEWLEALEGVVDSGGPYRARLLLRRLLDHARHLGAALPPLLQTPYINTIAPESEPPFPGDLTLEKRIRRIIRWNAMAMVARANRRFPGIGGHVATYASSASLYEVGFNHFFHGKDAPGGGDQLFIQGHASPGIYARAFLEGRLGEAELERFRRETSGRGLPSYPHPWLLPAFWEFPTVSMGLGPIAAIYQARFNRYLQARDRKDTSQNHVWCFVGDGECDEPEVAGSLGVAAREGLDNLTFVVNCNLQRLDGPVRGNGKIIQELEGVFRGAGWEVIKVIWGPEWDEFLAEDVDGVLVERLGEVVDGQFQKYSVETGGYIRRDFFGKDPRLLAMARHLSDEELRRLRRGGHAYEKIYAAYRHALAVRGAPVVVLAQTVKGWMLGEGYEASNAAHQMKKLDFEHLKRFRNTLELPISDAELEEVPYFHPGKNAPEVQYLMERRRALGGFLPERHRRRPELHSPSPELFLEFYEGTKASVEVSTTTAFVRLLRKLLRDGGVGKHIVPIIPDEARTFGMDPLFREIGIYAPHGQLYEPVDARMLLHYHEAPNGQLLEEGITEAGAMASFAAAATSYATHGVPVIPFYLFYSMFGLQRTGDQAWSLGDMRARGFLLGGTAGRTTLSGEGLQHQDGHSQLYAMAYPTMQAYDPAYAYEIAVIVKEGLSRMLEGDEDVFYYLTLYNENYLMPAMPQGAAEGILKGMYLVKAAPDGEAPRARVQLFASGPILGCALAAQALLRERYGVAGDVWSVTSYQQLYREARAAERQSRLHPLAPPTTPYVAQALAPHPGPVVAASDWVTALPNLVGRFVPRRFLALGTDGFGRSDTREALRRHFEIDAPCITATALHALAQEGAIAAKEAAQALRDFDIDPEKVDSALA
jgi:pyruvate dehydrogenase E1 component